MAFVLDPVLPGWAVWLFSASGNNPDVRAAFEAAATEHVDEVDLVTTRGDGPLASAAAILQGPRVHVVPVASEKDGFLATHSLMSTVTALLLAADKSSGSSTSERTRLLKDVAAREFSKKGRAAVHQLLEPLVDRNRDTLLILHDPGLAAAAAMIETSCWEAGLCAVQRTDFRNFAHGRHVGLGLHPEKTFVLALTHDRTREYWNSLSQDIPDTVERAHFDFGAAGRFGLYTGVLRSFAVVEALGIAKGIDPGKPGVADFGRRLFAREDLLTNLKREGVATRRKRRAEFKFDRESRQSVEWPAKYEEFVRQFADAEIGAVVLDYDGTVVSTDRRLDPPRPEVLTAIQKLVGSGLVVAFATGRGGSVGEMLRKHLPRDIWGLISVGYYNGAHIASLETDLEANPPDPDPVVASIFTIVCSTAGLFKGSWLPKAGPFQITVPIDRLSSPAEGGRKLNEIVGANPAARIFRSGHSMDICPRWVSKRRVVEYVRTRFVDNPLDVLTVGDSGDQQGNDYELLEGRFGLSVDRVCDRDHSCWNLLPRGVTGPLGLLTILSSLRETQHGIAQLDISALVRS
jgi:hypothetical protein